MSRVQLLGFARIVLLGVISFVLGYITIVVAGSLFIVNGFFALLFFAALFGLGWLVPPAVNRFSQSRRQLGLLLALILLSPIAWIVIVDAGFIDNEFTGVMQPFNVAMAFFGLPLGIAFSITMKQAIVTLKIRRQIKET